MIPSFQLCKKIADVKSHKVSDEEKFCFFVSNKSEPTRLLFLCECRLNIIGSSVRQKKSILKSHLGLWEIVTTIF